MKRPILTWTAGIALMTARLCAGEAAESQPAVPESAPAERAQIENYIRILKLEVDRGQVKADALKGQVTELDADIEARMDRIVKLLSSAREAAGAGAGGRKEKPEEGLIRNVQRYAQERDSRREGMDGDEADRTKALAALQARIEQQVTQSMTVLKANAKAREAAAGGRKSKGAAKAAAELEGLLRDMTGELRGDFARYKRLVAERAEARERVILLQNRMEAMKALL